MYTLKFSEKRLKTMFFFFPQKAHHYVSTILVTGCLEFRQTLKEK